MYHRIAEPESDPWSLCVSAQNFAQHLEILRRSTSVVALREMLHSRGQQRSKRHVVSLTFDDGYADNLLAARPLLERYQAPATIFLTAGALGSDREFWWDELERIFLQTENLPNVLEISIGDVLRRWKLGGSANYKIKEQSAHQSWKAGDIPPTVRQEIYYSIWALLRPLPHNPQRNVLDQLLAWADLGYAGRSSHRSLTKPEAVDLGHSELVEIGAHTMTHPELSRQPLAVQEDEIRLSRVELEKLLGREVTQFAYPYGDYSPATIISVQSCGFDLACTTDERRVPANIKPYELPRFQVQNWSGEEFECRLEKIFRKSMIGPPRASS